MGYGKLLCSLGKASSMAFRLYESHKCRDRFLEPELILCVPHEPSVGNGGNWGPGIFFTGMLCQTVSCWEAQEKLEGLQSLSAWPFPSPLWAGTALAAPQSPAFWEQAGGVSKQHLLPGSRALLTSGQEELLLPSFDSSPQPQLTLPARTQERQEGAQLWRSQGSWKSQDLPRCLWKPLAAGQGTPAKGEHPWNNPAGRGAVSQRWANPESVFTGRSSASPFLAGILQGRKVFSLPPCCFQVTGRNVGVGTAPGKHSGLSESLDLSPPVPNPTLVPSARQS